jgi:hypothetical protein
MYSHLFTLFISNQIHKVIKVFEIARCGTTCTPPPQLVDMRQQFPEVVFQFNNQRLEAHIPICVQSSPPPHARVNVTGDPTLPKAQIDCPKCGTCKPRVFSGGWSAILGAEKKGYSMWSQCEECRLTFNVHESPTFKQESYFRMSPSGPEVLERALAVWSADGDFPCYGDFSMQIAGHDGPLLQKDARAGDLYKIAKVLAPELFIETPAPPKHARAHNPFMYR